MNNASKYSAFGLVGILIFLSNCVHEVPVNPESPNDPAGTIVAPPSITAIGKICSADSVYFNNDVLPIITSNCSMPACHGGKKSPTLLTYTQISKNRGDIMEQVNRGTMPVAPVGRLSSAQIALLNKWVKQGYKNNSCTAACDTTKFTYTAVIDPIMKKYCVGCHTGGTASNKNVDLSTYFGTKTSALGGQLYKSVAHLAGAVAMPPTGTALSTCEVTQIRKWIAGGALN